MVMGILEDTVCFRVLFGSPDKIMCIACRVTATSPMNVSSFSLLEGEISKLQ